MDKPNPLIHRFLISTTSRFTGCYEGEFLRIDHAWQGANSGAGLRESMQENPRSRNYFVLSAEIDPPKKKSIVIPNYTPLGEQACAALSVLFGKRFDAHGLLVSHQEFYVPDFGPFTPTTYYEAAPYSHRPRQDLGIPLTLDRFGLVAPLFTDQSLDEKVRRIFFAAARFYLRSLQMFDVEPEFAYLDLITCGEILANFYAYTPDEIYDDEAKEIFSRIRAEMTDGEAVARKLQGRMRQIKRAYVLTLMRLLKDSFFDTSECKKQYGRLRKEDIEKRLKSAYDLRSQYVHTGIDFGRWTMPNGDVLNEVQLGTPVVESKEFEKAIAQAPTFFGLERIMRYCLARFLHLNGVTIDASLDEVVPAHGASRPVGQSVLEGRRQEGAAQALRLLEAPVHHQRGSAGPPAAVGDRIGLGPVAQPQGGILEPGRRPVTIARNRSVPASRHAATQAIPSQDPVETGLHQHGSGGHLHAHRRLHDRPNIYNTATYNTHYPDIKKDILDTSLSKRVRVTHAAHLLYATRNQVQHHIDRKLILYKSIEEAKFTSDVLLSLCRLGAWAKKK